MTSHDKPFLRTPCLRHLPVQIAALALLFLTLSSSISAADPCDACKTIEQQIEEAQQELEDLQGEQAEVEEVYDANLEAQLDTIALENEATRNYNNQIGTGASSRDPTTGISIDSRAGANGVVTITTTHPDGRVETDTRDSSYMKELREEISRQRERRGDLEREAEGLKDRLNELQGEIAGKQAELSALASALATCLASCQKQAILIDPSSHIAIHVAEGVNPQDVIIDYGLEGAEVVTVPDAAGGGHLVSAPKPSEEAIEEMENDPRCKEVDDDFCREFLPGTQAIPHEKQPLMLAQADAGSAMRGVTNSTGGAPRGGTSVTVLPEDPPVDDADPGWNKGDGDTPAIGVTGDDGKYKLPVDSDVLNNSHIVVAGTGWTTVTQTGGGTSTPAEPTRSEQGGGTGTGGTEHELGIEEVMVTGGKIELSVDYGYDYDKYGGTLTYGGGGGTTTGGNGGDDPRDTAPPVIYGEEVEEPERVGILLRLDNWHWIPSMNGVTWVTAKLYEPDEARPGIWKPTDRAQRVIKVEYIRRSNEPGQAMNWDLGSIAPEWVPDLGLRQEFGMTCSGDPAGKGQYNDCVTTSPHNEKSFVVASLDFGGYSRMDASCEDCVPLKAIYPYSYIGGYRPSKAWPDAVEEPDRNKRAVRVPHDENENNIADRYELDSNWAGIKADDDSETKPWGDGTAGDGYTAYQEYRGFKDKSINHRRTNWFKKTLLVDNRTGFSLRMFRTASNLEVLEIPRDAHKNRQANYNQHFAHKTDQHCLLMLVEELEGASGKVSDFGPPKNVEKVMIDTDYTSDKNNTVAHELGHAVNMRHHGDKGYTDIEVHPQSNILSGLRHSYTHGGIYLCRKFLPAKFELGQKGDQASGVENCIMRYRWSADVYQQADDELQCHRKGKPRELFCDSSTGTGQNRRGVSGDATKGDCKSQLIVNDG